ncbi:hypothetical protein MMH89_03355 [Candidatus Comchoanobacter bicostacola]|uniref:DNA polymerase III subunit chi n=1 Tax=Candidatus Comchoanobacter bicostacola TaxID=2919598 RepID=A0ABY5DJ41_9GAMM|nr:hypothetical protein [Candidatus Comchoanobacter bicostacola]UTC24260.1 hypothetical protein MMH89_03355 [Candidatus Comchoanobacter bicostacola]
MIKFHIHESSPKDWQALAGYIESIWPQKNLCIVCELEDKNDIQRAIWKLPKRFIAIDDTPVNSSVIYITSELPSSQYDCVINTSDQQLQHVNIEWVQRDKQLARNRYKHWKSVNKTIEIVNH